MQRRRIAVFLADNCTLLRQRVFASHQHLQSPAPHTSPCSRHYLSSIASPTPSLSPAPLPCISDPRLSALSSPSRSPVARTTQQSHFHSTTAARSKSDIDDSWVASFNVNSIPREKLTIKFARSGGAGGQNVNKVNTKVDLRFILDDADWIPEYAREKMKSMHPTRVTKRGEYTLTSTRYRTQMENLDDALLKLCDAVREAGVVPKGPDEDTVKRIQEFRKEGNEHRIASKKVASRKKRDRQWRE